MLTQPKETITLSHKKHRDSRVGTESRIMWLP